MYYLRGALNVASQYYKDLPAINPSTLTGAIDVIVVERPTSDGATELACSPFHVRFGKFQVLRPSERKVNVLLNGKPCPFNMKIGEAGEAFWVFETEDDVSEDIITSPVLAPLPASETALSRGSGAGALAAAEPDAHRRVSRNGNVAPSDESDADEPDFLDLNAAAPKRRPPPLRVSGLSATKPASLQVLDTPSKATPSSFSKLAPGASNGTSEANVGVFEKTEKLENLSPPSNARVAHKVADADAQPPHVEMVDGVAVDTLGYHARAASEKTIVGRQRRRKTEDAEIPGSSTSSTMAFPYQGREPFSDSDVSPASTRPSSPDSGINGLTRLNTDRASSEPPEDALPHDQYEWEWGAFPLKTPAIRDDNHFEFPLVQVIGSSPPAVPQDVPFFSERTSEKRAQDRLANLGRLQASDADNFLLVADDKKFEFELSLCGQLAQPVQLKDASSFSDKRVSYKTFLEDPNIVHHPKLVLRWNNSYISREDSSPLFSALVRWRQIALGQKPTAFVDDEPFSSSDERDASPSSTAVSTPNVSRTSSTWSRWWRGSSRSSTMIHPSAPPTERPALKEVFSAPAQTDLLSIKTTALPPVSQSVPLTPRVRVGPKHIKTLRLTSDQLRQLHLKKGVNTITFSLSATGAIACTARIFLWDYTDLVVVSDIDGTITKSDALGHVMTFLGRDWTHSGVAKLYTDIARNGYKILYLTSRAIGQAGSTRNYLKGINQDNHQLPEGPVIMSPDRLLTSLHREVIIRRPEMFKMACLKDLGSLFGSHNPFYAGFGNRITDAASYLAVDIPKARIFTIEYSGEVKMELLERAGFKSSYIHMTDLVDQMFPPVHRSVSPQYTDLNYWRTPMGEYELPDLTPPSPAMGVRSESTRLGRLTSAISLFSSRSRSPASGDHSRQTSPERNVLPLHAKDVEDKLAKLALADEEYIAQRQRRQSFDSTAVSLSSSLRNQWDMSTKLEEGDETQDGGADEEEYEEEDPEAEAEHAFDDDLLATGEMENVPFL